MSIELVIKKTVTHMHVYTYGDFMNGAVKGLFKLAYPDEGEEDIIFTPIEGDNDERGVLVINDKVPSPKNVILLSHSSDLAHRSFVRVVDTTVLARFTS